MSKAALFGLLAFALGAAPPFEPAHRLSGIGVARAELDDELLARRTDLMIDAQTFAILRDPRATEAAQRILGTKLQKIFAEAETKSGLPASLIAAVAYLESWGDPNAQSPTGPKGIMQMVPGTARSMGLKIVYETRYKVVSEKRTFKGKKGKLTTKVVKRRAPYTVLVRDERLIPELAIPAAAVYLKRLEGKFGGIDWAIFAYHCGEGCVGSMRNLVEQMHDIKPPYTVPKMFFQSSPVYNREVYQAVQREMQRDWSPTYYFRIRCAQKLLNLYKEDPGEFKRLAAEYRYEPNPQQRAPHRLAVWLRATDLIYQSPEDITHDEQNLVSVPDSPDRFGFRIRRDDELVFRATPSAIGTLLYVSYETRRLFQAMKPREAWVPLEVTSLVRPASSGRLPESVAHASGQVFDLDYRNLPLAEREALDFVLEDMGSEGYVGFIQEAPGSGTLHIGCAPSMRDFFNAVYEEARGLVPPKGLQERTER